MTEEDIKTERINNPDGTYIVKTSYREYDDNGWKSTSEKYDKFNNFLSGEYYQDNDFKVLGQKTVKTTYYNGSYRYTKTRTIPDQNGWFIINEFFDGNNELISGIYETLPKDANQVILKETIKYNNDGTYERCCSYLKQKKDADYLSFVEQYNSNNEFISTKLYRDKNFMDLFYSCNREPLSKNHYIDKVIEDNTIGYNNYKSRTIEVVADEHIEKELYYKNKDYTGLIASSHSYINSNGNWEQQMVYEDEQDGWYSSLFERDKQDNIIKQVWFVDSNMQQPYCEQTFEYQDKDNYICKTFYHKSLKKEEHHTIKYYSNGILVKTLYYMILHFIDSDLNRLYATDTYEYLPNGDSVVHRVFEEKYKDTDMMSMIEYKNKNNPNTNCLCYTDKNFKNPLCKSWIKYIDDYGIRLTIYDQMQDGFNTEIEKLDRDKNLISKKQYKVNYAIAKFLFMIAR